MLHSIDAPADVLNSKNYLNSFTSDLSFCIPDPYTSFKKANTRVFLPAPFCP